MDRVVLREDVVDAAGHLAADGDRAPTAQELVVLDDDVGARYADPAPVDVAAGLDDHPVVAGVERTAGDVDVGARLGVAAVDRRAPGEHVDVADGHILRQHRVQVPHRRVLQVDPVDQDVGAPVELDEAGGQLVALAEDALAGVDPVDRLLLQLGPVVVAVAVAGPAGPRAGRALAVEGTGAGDRDVGLPEGVDERREVHALDTLPAAEHQRVLVGVRAELGRPEHVQVHIGQ